MSVSRKKRNKFHFELFKLELSAKKYSLVRGIIKSLFDSSEQLAQRAIFVCGKTAQRPGHQSLARGFGLGQTLSPGIRHVKAVCPLVRLVRTTLDQTFGFHRLKRHTD